MPRLTGIFLTLALVAVAKSIPCPEDAKVCPGGTVVGRDSSNNCEFFPCPSVVCTQETHQCSDGTHVGRDSNNNCEFFPCPSLCIKEVKQCADGSFVGRDSNNNCEFFPCPVVAAKSSFCTQETKVYPDSTHVRRDSSNNCEFFSCSSLICTKDAKGQTRTDPGTASNKLNEFEDVNEKDSTATPTADTQPADIVLLVVLGLIGCAVVNYLYQLADKYRWEVTMFIGIVTYTVSLSRTVIRIITLVTEFSVTNLLGCAMMILIHRWLYTTHLPGFIRGIK
eukprot:TRINITY_DN283_c0_g1_i1.p1 TRINITY_DN283_c0_g1~~TRINITY_DN283_c0_g1_i1.p1  ORF type:complete len:280 (+),score=28.99 TRINITY_DN283_c0_g1_i1:55-894(+)